METLHANTIPTGSDSRSQAFEAPCGEKGVVYQVTGARRKIGTYCEGQTETLGAFLSSFKLFGINRFRWRSSLPCRLLLAFRRCVDTEALSSCIQLHIILPSGHEWDAKGGIGRTRTSGSRCCFLDFSPVDLGCFGSTSGIPNRAARALCFSSSGSSTAGASPGVVVEVIVGAGSCKSSSVCRR
jgi:hypothetical protein